MKLLIAALLGFLIVLICAAYFVYGNWKRRPQLTAAVPPAQQQQEAAAPAPTPTPEPTPTDIPQPSATPTPIAPEPTPVEQAPPPSVPARHNRGQTAPASQAPTHVEQQPAPVESLPPAPPQAQPQQQQPEPQPHAEEQQQPAQQPPPVAPPPPRAPARPVYAGPRDGWITWSGKLNKNDTLTIDGGTASTGYLTGELPGVPVNIVVDVSNIGLAEEPNPNNNFKRLVLHSLGKHNVIRIHWTVR
ncbi:MAG TPA: hypothetical protein VFA04_19415 [Bryobacteraceae bacterium]|nr:hypothetical protein [Bryobacteraceae bacterium]